MTYSNISSYIHKFCACVLSSFILAHLINHLMAVNGIDTHTHIMHSLRQIYRHPVGESILMLSILLQIGTGVTKIRRSGWRHVHFFDRLQVYSGAYLLLFLLAHTTAIWNARLLLGLETDFYFGAIVWLKKPYVYGFALYYFGGIVAFFAHLACVLRWVLIRHLSPYQIQVLIWSMISLGVLIWLVILFAFSGMLFDIDLPEVYHSYLP